MYGSSITGRQGVGVAIVVCLALSIPVDKGED